VSDIRGEIALNYPHLANIVVHIPPIDHDAHIILLIVRERIEAQHVLDQKIGPRHTQFTQIIALGWTLIGKGYFGKTHDHETVVANKTHGLSNVREQIPKPCINEFVIKEKLNCCSNTLTCKELITWKTSVKHTATI
jgi:hypothetical protein